MSRYMPFALLVCLALPASSTGAVWFSATGGYSTYAMSEANAYIRHENVSRAPAVMTEIKGGESFALGVGVSVSRNVTVGLERERLSAKSDVPGTDWSDFFDYEANAYKASLFYRLATAPQFIYGLGGAVGVVTSTGAFKGRFGDEGAMAGSIDGTGLIVEGFFLADYRRGARTALTGSAVYRFAKVGEPEVRGTPLRTRTGIIRPWTTVGSDCVSASRSLCRRGTSSRLSGRGWVQRLRQAD
jgi:hypothetical protein